MTLKNLLMLTGVVAGAAYLQNKGRRDRVFGQARGMFDKVRTRATELAHQAESMKESALAGKESSSRGAGATTLDNSFGTAGGNGTTGYGTGGIGGNYR